MSGKILIVDELATNRIVLKVKLSAAYYDVLQAGSMAEALDLAEKSRPDLILANAELSGFDNTAFLRRLRTLDDLRDIPVVLILPDNANETRIAALRAGANDVMVKPLEETMLLARLRNLLRQRHIDHDLKLHAGTARALGFAEAQQVFQHPGRVALIAAKQLNALHLRTRLSHCGGHEYYALGAEQAVGFARDGLTPDLYVLQIEQENADVGLHLMAELRAAPLSRNCPIVVILSDNAHAIAATALDMGASEVIRAGADPQELLLRMSAQLKNKRAADQMRDQLQNGLHAAVIDPLTGLYNRRYALPYLKRLATSAYKEGRTFAVMVADLDHFKQVNDGFGHAAGDKVLVRVAQQLCSNLKEDDLIARIGGEEFLIVIPETTRTEARQTASRLCQIIQNTPIHVLSKRKPLHVTISIGVTLGNLGGAGVRPTVEALLDQADRALYGSKADGRNTVTLCERSAA